MSADKYPKIFSPQMDATVYIVHTTPQKSKNASLFVRLGQPSRLILHEKELFENNDVTIIARFPWQSFPQTQIKSDQWLLRFQIPLV